jgi:hypothetical protein
LIKFNKDFLLDNWCEEHKSDEEDFYTCPECEYTLDFVQDDEGLNYVYCWNKCFETYIRT